MKNNNAVGLVVLCLSVQACTYNGKIKDSLSTSSASLPSTGSSSNSITLIDNRDEIQNPKFKYGVATVNYDIKDAMMSVAKDSLKKSFGRVDISKTPIPTNPLYAIPHFEMAASNGNDITTGLSSKATIDLYNTAEKRYLTSITSVRNTQYVRPASLNALGFLTGFTLFVATPFTLPAAVNIAGENVGDLIEENKKDLTVTLSNNIISKINVAEAKASVASCYDTIVRDPSLDVLSGKISLHGVKNQSFDMLANTKKPNAAEKEAIRIWQTKVERCETEDEALKSQNVPRGVVEANESLRIRKNDLIIALYNGEITYGEFARKRRENALEFDKNISRVFSDLDREIAAVEDRQRQMDIELERNSIARAQANAAESMAFNSMISNIQQANSNLIQQQTLNRLNSQPIYRGPVHTTCTPGFGSVNCTTY